MATFAETYRAIVMPRLRALAWTYAISVACGGMGFSEALGRLESQAWRSGGSALPEAMWGDLEGLLATLLLTEIDKFEREAR